MPRPFPSTDPNAPDPHPDEYQRLLLWEEAEFDPKKYRDLMVAAGLHIPDGPMPDPPTTGSSSERIAKEQPVIGHP